MDITNIGQIREIMERYGVSFKKKYGQNFLTNASIPTRIADCVRLAAVDRTRVIEIGAGIGTLTRSLCMVCDTVTAVEIDAGLIPILRETLADCPNAEIVCADIMKTDLAELSRGEEYVCAGNLPYYITSPIIMSLIENERNLQPKEIIVMVQKEVCDRLCAAPGTPEYGAITAGVAYYGTAVKVFGVPRGNFTPIPKVDSAVVKITRRETPVTGVDSKTVRRVIRGAFARRRKTLPNSLAGEFGDLSSDSLSSDNLSARAPGLAPTLTSTLTPALADIIKSAGINPAVRGETLSIDEFIALAKAIEAFL